ncbi:MAG: hypothetical protein KBD56_01430 [Candidatus Eisenbacteria bacterium]|nr:hypothetical protein [Candidatus Eisenbacteria bacterium]
MVHSVYTLAEKPGLRNQIDQLSGQAWPRFLLHGNVKKWHLLFEIFAPYQLIWCDAAGNLLAVGHSVPLVWDGSPAGLPSTIDEILGRAEGAVASQQAPNTFSVLAAMVRPDQRGQHLSRAILQAMRSLAQQQACSALIAPVRPTWKSRYPLTPMERYVTWKRSDGMLFDPWLRVHERLGARPLGIAPNTLTVVGTVKEWEEWTEMVFPETGRYVIPGALQPVEIDCEQDRGCYADPNYWMVHWLG